MITVSIFSHLILTDTGDPQLVIHATINATSSKKQTVTKVTMMKYVCFKYGEYTATHTYFLIVKYCSDSKRKKMLNNFGKLISFFNYLKQTCSLS